MIKKLFLLLCVNFFAQAMECDEELRQACNDCKDGIGLCCVTIALHAAIAQRLSTPEESHIVPLRWIYPCAVGYGCYLWSQGPVMMLRGSAVFVRRGVEFVACHQSDFIPVPDHMRME